MSFGLGDIFGGGDNEQTVKNEPWSGVQPYLKDIYQIAQNQFNAQGPQYYPGQTFAPLDPLQMGGQQMALSQVFGQSKLPRWWTPQMPGPQGSLQGSFAQPYNAPPLQQSGGGQPNPFASMFQPFGSMAPQLGGNQYIPGAGGMPGGSLGGMPGGAFAGQPSGGFAGMPNQPQNTMPNTGATYTPPTGGQPWTAASLPTNSSGGPLGGGGFPQQRLGNPLPQDELNLGPGQTGSAYDIGGGRTLYTGGAQSASSLARQDRRRLQNQAKQLRGGMSVDYDRSQFSDRLNDFLNSRVSNYNNWDAGRQNSFLNRLGGFGELESARRQANPDYAALMQQLAAR